MQIPKILKDREDIFNRMRHPIKEHFDYLRGRSQNRECCGCDRIVDGKFRPVSLLLFLAGAGVMGYGVSFLFKGAEWGAEAGAQQTPEEKALEEKYNRYALTISMFGVLSIVLGCLVKCCCEPVVREYCCCWRDVRERDAEVQNWLDEAAAMVEEEKASRPVKRRAGSSSSDDDVRDHPDIGYMVRAMRPAEYTVKDPEHPHHDPSSDESKSPYAV